MIRYYYEQVQTKRNIQNKLRQCYIQKEGLTKKVNELRKQLHKEMEDVERLENGHLAYFFYELMGNTQQKLEKERQEAYEAKTKYDTAMYQLSAIESDIVSYERQLNELKDCEELFKKAYEDRLSNIKHQDTKIIEIEKSITKSLSRQKEIKEAIEVGMKAYQLADKAYDALDSADGWATMDMFSRGMISDIAKYSHLNKAELLINELQVYLSRFQTELSDVSVDANIQVSIDGFMKFADYIFDNIFTDWAVRDRISNSINQIKNTMNRIHCIIRDLEKLLEDEVHKENKLKEELEKRVVGL